METIPFQAIAISLFLAAVLLEIAHAKAGGGKKIGELTLCYLQLFWYLIKSYHGIITPHKVIDLIYLRLCNHADNDVSI